MSNLDAQAIIIGAGIAGLTAAWELKKVGVQSIILEASEAIGGRMQSVQIADALIDTGAQFLSSAYSVIPVLIKEVGLQHDYVETSDWLGIENNNGLHLIHPRQPWYFISNRLLSLRSLLRFAFTELKLFCPKLNLNDISYWTQHDTESAQEWVTNSFGKETTYELISPIFNGFYFQSLKNSSAALAAAVLAFPGHRPKTMTLMFGMGSLPLRLAKQLNVKTNVSALTINETKTGVNIISNVGEFNAEHVIITTPAPIARNLILNPDKWTALLFETRYSSTMILSLLTNSNWNLPPKLKSTYGVLINPQVEGKIAALTIENNKCQSRKKHGFLINVMLTDDYTKNHFGLSDEEIFSAIKPEVEQMLPDIYSYLETKVIFRWGHAMPYTPVGRANAVKEYRHTRSKNNRLWLAGDYLGLPWTDSAAQTGLWAANQVYKKIQG